MPIFMGGCWIGGIKREWDRRKIAIFASFEISYMKPKLLCRLYVSSPVAFHRH